MDQVTSCRFVVTAGRAVASSLEGKICKFCFLHNLQVTIEILGNGWLEKLYGVTVSGNSSAIAALLDELRYLEAILNDPR